MRRCLLVLAAAAASDDVPFELRDVYGPPPAKAAVALPLLHEPRVKLWWPSLDDVGGGAEIKRPPRDPPRHRAEAVTKTTTQVVEIAQDSSEPYDAPTTLWPAGAVLAHALASDCASWKDRVVLELGVGVGAPALALARCNASVVATDISEAALALTAENTNGTVVTRLLDWDDDGALAAVVAEHGPFFAVVGAALKYEAWPAGRLDAILDSLNPTVVVLAHAWTDDDDDILGDVWRRAASFAGAAVGLEEFSAVTWVRRAAEL